MKCLGQRRGSFNIFKQISVSGFPHSIEKFKKRHGMKIVKIYLTHRKGSGHGHLDAKEGACRGNVDIVFLFSEIF